MPCFIKKHEKYSCKIENLTWDRNAFCRGWLITGTTGSGKTLCGINVLMHQVFQNESGKRDPAGKILEFPWGGLCIDEKGLYWNTLKEMVKHYSREKDLVLLQTRPDSTNFSWKPTFCFNLLSDERIPSNTYASAIVNTSISITGGDSEKGFFRVQAESNIGWAIELIRSIGTCQRYIGFREKDCLKPNLKLVLQLLTDRSAFDRLLQECEVISDQIEEIPKLKGTGNRLVTDKDGNEILTRFPSPKLSSEKLEECIEHFENRFWSQPKDQLGGVQGTIYNYLNYFSNDDIAEVFCAHNTFEFDAIDQGKIICVSMPQKLQIERRYVCTLLKLLFYMHALRRFDKPTEEFNNKNLLICWQDEAQRFITEADGNVDVIREASATTVMACQSQTSLFPPLGGKDNAKVIILNLRNRIIFRASDEDCAHSSAEFIGKVEKMKREISHNKNGKNTLIRKQDVYKVNPSSLRQMKDFTAIICHSDGKVAKYRITPKTSTNQIPAWWLSISFFSRVTKKDFLREKL